MTRFDRDSRDWLDTPARKRAYNRAHFAAAAARYDRATVAMSLGRDASWKQRLIACLPAVRQPVCLDLACGSGDLSRLLAARYPRGRILGLDLSAEMLAIAIDHNALPVVDYLRGDLDALPVATASCDIVTGGYALRNAPDLDRALAEIARVLKPGGCAAFLDFAKAGSRFGQSCQYHLLRRWCGLWGRLLSGSWQVHGYIAESLRRFPDQAELDQRLHRQGLRPTQHRRLFGGLLQLVVVQRPPPAAGAALAPADNRSGR